MSRHRFGDLAVETKFLGPSPIIANANIYSVKVIDQSGENWIERKLVVHGQDRTPAAEASVMANVLLELLNVADNPEAWGKFAKNVEGLHETEIEAVQNIAERLALSLPLAAEEALAHQGLFEEYREGSVGPLDVKLSGRRKN